MSLLYRALDQVYYIACVCGYSMRERGTLPLITRSYYIYYILYILCVCVVIARERGRIRMLLCLTT